MSRGIGSMQRRVLASLYLASELSTPLFEPWYTISQVDNESPPASDGRRAYRSSFRRAARRLQVAGFIDCEDRVVPLSKLASARADGDRNVLLVKLAELGHSYIAEHESQLAEEFTDFALYVAPSSFRTATERANAAVPLLHYVDIVEPFACWSDHLFADREVMSLVRWWPCTRGGHGIRICLRCGRSQYGPPQREECGHPAHPFASLIRGLRALPGLNAGPMSIQLTGRHKLQAMKARGLGETYWWWRS
ncbi:hypothetical protein [Nocardia salmonicida]|uniref:hypothetical protein n=1 Tax=Nocardia salmonicida TaxID=53431 RepID=UPI0037903682